jgi:hypothetical protein
VNPATISYLVGTPVTSKLGSDGCQEHQHSVDLGAGAGLPFLPTGKRWMGAQAQAHASPVSPYATSKVDGDTAWDGAIGAKNGAEMGRKGVED